MASENTTKPHSHAKGQFEVKVVDDYVHLVTRGRLNIDNVEAPANAALTLAKEKKVRKLLDDIREVDAATSNIPVQTKGFGVLWKLRAFDKVAIVFKQEEFGFLFFSSLQAMHITSKFKGFDNETDAIAWLREDK